MRSGSSPLPAFMKLLMFQARHFNYLAPTRPGSVSHPDPGVTDEISASCPSFVDAIVVFVHSEPHDLEREANLLRKAAKNIKWLANKRSWRQVVLHSFVHLAEEKAPAEFGASFLSKLADRTSQAGYDVRITPDGSSLQWDLGVYEEPLAKVFKSL